MLNDLGYLKITTGNLLNLLLCTNFENRFECGKLQTSLVSWFFSVRCNTLCLKKNDNDVAHYNFNAH